MQNLTRCAFSAAIFALMCAALPVSAQETVRIRGTIEHVDGPIFVIKNRDSAEVKLTLTDKPLFVAIVKSTIAEIKPGMFVGSTGMTQADGSQRAIEVHIFPESMRGTGEGHFDWDLKPQSKMTNANVEKTVAGVDGQMLSVKYKGIEKKILLPPTLRSSPSSLVTGATLNRGPRSLSLRKSNLMEPCKLHVSRMAKTD